MQPQDKDAFAELMILTSEMYERKEKPSVPMLRMYFAALERFSLDDVRAGLNGHIQNPDNGQFFPKPADIIRCIGGSSDTKALGAWSKVDKAIRCVGSYQTVIFDDPLIHAVIRDMGGWVMLCSVDEREYPFKCNEFVKRYRGFAITPPENYPKQLLGIAQSHNEANGHDVSPPVLIGDEKKAALTYERGESGPGIAIQRGLPNRPETDGPKKISNFTKAG